MQLPVAKVGTTLPGFDNGEIMNICGKHHFLSLKTLPSAGGRSNLSAERLMISRPKKVRRHYNN